MAILVVEDDDDILDLLCFALRRAGHDVLPARDGLNAISTFRTRNPKLVLLDVHLPRMDGWEVARQIRSESNTPIIMLTGAGSDEDVVKGFKIGADDYVTKPFSYKQLTARIEAVLSRAQQTVNEPRSGFRRITAGDLVLDPQFHSVEREGPAVRLTALEFKLLYELVLHEGQVLPHQVLIDRVWGYDGVDDAALIKGHIRNLRRKLSDDATDPRYIHTISGVGYTFRRQAGAA
jgi:DNA-binding response OmpR family regulator